MTWSTFSAGDWTAISVSFNHVFFDKPVCFWLAVIVPQTAQPVIQVLANWTKNENIEVRIQETHHDLQNKAISCH